jgi:DedD protein
LGYTDGTRTVETPIKHRITGAIILVALVVVLVPEMLSGPRAPETAPPANSINLPTSGAAATAPLRSIDIDVAERAPGRGSLRGSTRGPEAPAGEAAGDTGSGSASAAPPAPAVAAPSVAAAPVAAAPAAAAPDVSPGVSPLAAAQPASAGPARVYVVQVGSFAARTTADALAATLRRQGFAATVSRVQAGGRTLHRVRVGPASARAEADALRARLRTAGHSGSVVAGP